MLQTAMMPVRRLADHLAAGLCPPDRADEWRKLSAFLNSAASSGLDLSQAAVVLAGDRVVWACLAVRSPGRTSLLMLGPLPGAGADRVSLVDAVRQLTARETDCGVALIQALLPPSQQAEARLLLDAGFRRLAELIYMHAPLPDTLLNAAGGEDAWPAGPDDRVVSCRPELFSQFAETIQATYARTMDCPGLEGLRPMEDVMASHRGSGLFRADLWFLFMRNAQPIGVALVNEVADTTGEAVELVYMGLVESARGRGLSRRLLHHAMVSARRAGYIRMLLAVDSGNAAALRLYRGKGFTETMRRMAFVLALPRAAGRDDVRHHRDKDSETEEG